MGGSISRRPTSAVPDEDDRVLDQFLAGFDLCLDADNGNSWPYARLSGSTFPFDRMLTTSGAFWEPETQSWTFAAAKALRDFVASLKRTSHDAATSLAEEPAYFAGAGSQEKPLERFLTLGPAALQNDDLLELLLSFDSYVADPAETSRRLFEEFGSLGAILASESVRLRSFEDVTPRVFALLKAIQLTIERVLHEPIKDNPIIGSWEALLDYLRGRLQHRQREELLILYLNRKNRLIKIQAVQGTVAQVPFYPRDISAKALELFASAVIVAHNHPSGELTPSKSDLETTAMLKAALQTLGIELYDHFIVGHQSVLSFKGEGLI